MFVYNTPSTICLCFLWKTSEMTILQRVQEESMIIVGIEVNGGVINDQFRNTSRNRVIIRCLESVNNNLLVHMISANEKCE